MMLINDISRLFGTRMRKAADEAGIPSGYRYMLMYLAHHDGISQLELAKRLHITAPTVSVTLHKMEQDGYITRRPDKHDQRQMLVFLTDTGKETEKIIHEKATETEELSLLGFSEEEKKIIKEYLLRMYQNLGGNDCRFGDFESEKECDKT